MTPDDRRRLGLISHKHRLHLEIKIPSFARSRTGAYTMKAARHWLQTSTRSRKRMLQLVEEALAEGMKAG